MPLRAFHINTTGLFRHTVIVADTRNAGRSGYPRFKLFRRNSLVNEVLPAAAMYQYPIRNIKAYLFFFKNTDHVFIDDKGETEGKHRLARMFGKKVLNSRNIQLHIFVKRVTGTGGQQREAQNTGSSCRKHLPVPQRFFRIEH